MLTPSSIRSIPPAIATYKVEKTEEVAKHIRTCSREKISGRLDLSFSNHSKPVWSLFFRLGYLVWCVGEWHPLRRWNRQLVQYCPDFAAGTFQHTSERPSNWSYESIIDLVKRGQVQREKLARLVTGTTLENLFDIIQLGQQALETGEMRLTYYPFPRDLIDSTVISLQVDEMWRKAEQAWSVWQQSGLARLSPNLSPVIWDDEALRKQTSILAYHNLSQLASGIWTLRDLAIKISQPLVPMTRSLLPYIDQKVMGLKTIGDLQFYQRPTQSPVVAYIEDSRFDRAAMSHILDRAGCRFVSIDDAMQAISMLLEHKPDLIFLDLLMPIANGYEVCTQIRRVTAFKDTPILILTSSDGIVDRVRAKLVGASGFLSKPIEPDKVLNALQQYLPNTALSSDGAKIQQMPAEFS